jgi:DNA-directed RNA polymerase subunit L
MEAELEEQGTNTRLEIEAGADASKATFTLTHEDHTLGNAVRYILAKKCARHALALRARHSSPTRARASPSAQ